MSKPSPTLPARSFLYPRISRYNESFEFDVSNPASLLSLECWEEDAFSNTYVGGATVPIIDLSNGEKVNWKRRIRRGGFDKMIFEAYL